MWIYTDTLTWLSVKPCWKNLMETEYYHLVKLHVLLFSYFWWHGFFASLICFMWWQHTSLNSSITGKIVMCSVESSEKYKAEIKGEVCFQICRTVFSSNLHPVVWENLLHLFWFISFFSEAYSALMKLKKRKGTMYNISFVFCTQSFQKS